MISIRRVTFLPILRRDLAIAARRTATYRQRVLFGAPAAAVVVFLLLYLPLTTYSGATIFRIVSWGGFILCLLEGLRSTADSVSLERREGTLGLLLLTDLRGNHVVTGKVASACVQSLSTVVAILPAFSLPLLLGGVTAGECWRIMVTLLATSFFAVSFGTLVSVSVTSAFAAFATAALLVLAILVPPHFLASFSSRATGQTFAFISGPLEMLFQVPDASFTARPALFWLATGDAILVGVLMLVAAGWVLERFPQLEPKHTDTWLQRAFRPQVDRSESWGGGSARTSPSVWLAERTMPGRQALWILIALGALFCFFAGWLGGKAAIPCILGCEVFFGFLIKLWLSAVAPMSLSASRRNGALELLLCTPVPSADIVRGHVDALYGFFLAPALMISVGFSIVGMLGVGFAQIIQSRLPGDASPLTYGIFWFILFILDLHALAYAGLWFGLTNARVNRAIGKTVFAVMLLPWITLVIPFAGVIGVLAWPIFWIYWASGKLAKRFREEAAIQHAAGADDSGWWPRSLAFLR